MCGCGFGFGFGFQTVKNGGDVVVSESEVVCCNV